MHEGLQCIEPVFRGLDCAACALRRVDLRSPGTRKMLKPAGYQCVGVPWTQGLILGVLDMPDRILITWYSRLGVKRSLKLAPSELAPP